MADLADSYIGRLRSLVGDRLLLSVKLDHRFEVIEQVGRHQITKGSQMLKYVKFVELPVIDQRRAIRFCTKRLGFGVAQDSAYKDGWHWVELEIPGAQTRVFLTKKETGGRAGVPSLVLIADDVQATHDELKGKGVVFTKVPSPAPWNDQSVYALFEDSEGHVIMLGSS